MHARRSTCPRSLPAVVAGALLSALAAPPAAQSVSFHSTAIDLTPDGNEVWVVNPDHGSVGVLDAVGSGGLLVEIPVGPEPWCVDITPDGTEAWVTSMGNHAVYILDTAAKAVVDSIPNLGFETFGVAFNPAGSVALVTASGSDQIFAIDVATRAVTNTMAASRRPRGIAWREDGQRAWVTHLLMPEFTGRLTTVFPETWTTASIFINQVFGSHLAGYPSTMQNITLAPAPNSGILWLPNNMINTTAGGVGPVPLSPTNTFHAVIRPVNITTSTDMPTSTYFLSEPPGTPVGGPIAVDFGSGRAYVANHHSDNVTVMNQNVLSPVQLAVVPVGSAPIGIVTHTSLTRAYVANWLSRTVSVIGTGSNLVINTMPTTTTEPLTGGELNGKRLFFTSTGAMSLDGRGSCASCHVFGTADGRPWDLSQFGKFLRSTPDIRGIGFTGPHDWTADKDEMADHNFGILEFTGGVGLLPGGGNPPLGAPNAGISGDLDDIGEYMSSLKHRLTTPFRNPDGTLTAEADSGEVLFHDAVVGCATCHSGPLFTDSSLDEMPFIKHDVGTAFAADTNAAPGLDTPSLIGVWDTAPYLHHGNIAFTLGQVLTTSNPNDEHGTTSHLNSTQIGYLVSYLKQLAWPDSVGAPTGVGVAAAGPTREFLDAIAPNPFAENTSLRFTVDGTTSNVVIDIFDVTGRRVRELIDRPVTRGSHVVGWDSRDDRGTRVAAGTYFARLSVNGRPAGDKKMTVLR